MEELEELVAALRKEQSNPSADKTVKYLRLVRELKLTEPEGVALYGSKVLQQHRKQLSEEELWLVHEQVAVALLTLGQVQAAAHLIRAVAKRFPDTMRANRLKGMYWEAQGQYDQAATIYQDMLAAQPACEMAAKRLAAVEKSRGNLTAAAEALRKYVDVWSNDREAWEELGEVHLQLLQYRQALFCWEELLTLAPGHLPYLIRYADLLYTLGGNSNLKLARAYYSKAVELSGGHSVRALWGLAACCANITDKVSLQDSQTRAVIELPGLTADALQHQYRQHAPAKLEVVQRVLQDSLQPS